MGSSSAPRRAPHQFLRSGWLVFAIVLATCGGARAQAAPWLDLASNPIAAGGPPIFKMVQDGRAAEVREEIAAMPGLVKVHNPAGQTLLHVAAARRDIGLVTLLLENGAEVDARDQLQRTPLYLAYATGWRAAEDKTAPGPVVELLLNKGADANARDSAGRSPLSMAPEDRTASELLRARGGKYYTPDTVLMEAYAGGDNARAEKLLADNPWVADAQQGNGHSLLHEAVQYRDTALASWLLGRGFAVDAMDFSGRTPLAKAIESRQTMLVDLLLAKGAVVDGPPPLAKPLTSEEQRLVTPVRTGTYWPLEKAIESGSAELVTRFVNAGADLKKVPRLYTLSALGSLGQAAVCEAARSGDHALLKLLFEKGAAPPSMAALEWPLKHGDEATVRLLLDQGAPASIGAQPGYRGDGSQSPLVWAATRRGNAGLGKLLLEKGAERGLADGSGGFALREAIRRDDPEMLQVLLDKGALAASQGWSARENLMDAALRTYDSRLPLILMRKGAAPTGSLVAAILASDLEGVKTLPLPVTERGAVRTPLHLAAWLGQPALVAALLERGQDVQALTYSKETPLHLAALSGDVATIALLLEKGAGVDAMAYGGTPLHFAAMSGSGEAVAALLKAGATRDMPVGPRDGSTVPGESPLQTAARYGNSAAVTVLLAAGAAPDAVGPRGVSPLDAAARSRDVKTIAALLNRGAAITRDKSGQTTWTWAVQGLPQEGIGPNWANAPFPKRVAEVVPALEALKKAARDPLQTGPAAPGVNKLDAQWELPAGVAVQNNDVAALTWLLDNGTAPGARNSRGQALLHVAAAAGSEACVALLLARKADPDAEDDYGNTPVDVAERRGQIRGSYLDFPFTDWSTSTGRPDWDTPAERPVLLRGDQERIARQLRAAGGGIGGGPLMRAVNSGAFAVVRELLAQKPALAKTVMKKGSNENFRKGIVGPPSEWVDIWETPLTVLMGTRQGKPEMARLLLKAGVPLRVEHQSRDVLEMALDTRSPELLRVLADNGATLRRTDPVSGRTLLFQAASMGSVELTRFLLDNGVDPNVRDGYGGTAINQISKSDAGLAVKTLLEARGAKVFPSWNWLIYNDDDAGLAAVLDADPKMVAHRFPGGDSFLHLAIQGARLKTAKLLLARGADVNAIGEGRETPLHEALGPWEPLHSSVVARYKAGEPVPGKPGTSTILLKLLLDKGANPNLDPDQPKPAANTTKGTDVLSPKRSLTRPVLFRAIQRGDLESVAVLLDRGARLDIKDAAGITPLAWAVERKKPEVEALLRARGAKE